MFPWAQKGITPADGRKIYQGYYPKSLALAQDVCESQIAELWRATGPEVPWDVFPGSYFINIHCFSSSRIMGWTNLRMWSITNINSWAHVQPSQRGVNEGGVSLCTYLHKSVGILPSLSSLHLCQVWLKSAEEWGCMGITQLGTMGFFSLERSKGQSWKEKAEGDSAKELRRNDKKPAQCGGQRDRNNINNPKIIPTYSWKRRARVSRKRKTPKGFTEARWEGVQICLAPSSLLSSLTLTEFKLSIPPSAPQSTVLLVVLPITRSCFGSCQSSLEKFGVL